MWHLHKNKYWTHTENECIITCASTMDWRTQANVYVILNGIDLMWWNERRKTVQLLIVATTYYKTFFIHSIDSRAQGFIHRCFCLCFTFLSNRKLMKTNFLIEHRFYINFLALRFVIIPVLRLSQWALNVSRFFFRLINVCIANWMRLWCQYMSFIAFRKIKVAFEIRWR